MLFLFSLMFLFLFKPPCHCQAALSIVHVSFFRGNTIGLKNLCHLAVSPLLPGPSPPLPPSLLLRVFSTRVAIFVVVNFQWCTVFPLRVYERHGACLCPEMLGSSVMWWVYIFENNPHSLHYEHNSNLKFCCWWWWSYIFFSVQQCTVMKTILFYCRISFLWICCLCSTCCTETFQRKQEILLLFFFSFFGCPNCPLQLISSGPYFFLFSL